MRTTSAARALMLGALVFALAATVGCVRVELEDGGYETTTERIDAEGATSAKVTVAMGAGVLRVEGGAEALMNATFEHGDPSWAPEVTYEVDGGEGDLRVEQPDRVDLTPLRDVRYLWDIALTNDLPLELEVDLGAGEAELDLRNTDLRELSVQLGAGQTTIDLSGEWANDLDAEIQAGAGELTLRVPENVGVRIVGYRDGIGTYSADGFEQDGDALVNDAWETADVKFDIVLRRGVGEVTIVTVS